MKITIISDDVPNWFIPYGEMLKEKLKTNYNVSCVHNKNDIEKGDICFILSFTKIIQPKFLNLNRNNIVVHASDLPQGKGFSPVQWQILEGKNEIVLTLFEAVKDVDAGPYYFKDKLVLMATDLLPEIRRKLGIKIVEMCLQYIENISELKPIEQSGDDSFFSKRNEKDDEIDIDRTIREQFDHFRIANNNQFPLYFNHLGEKYILKIYSDSEN